MHCLGRWALRARPVTRQKPRAGFSNSIWPREISISLGVLNLLPFPILDGGMIFFLLIESLIRRDININVKERIYQVAFVLIVALFAFLIFNDMTKLPFFEHLKQ